MKTSRKHAGAYGKIGAYASLSALRSENRSQLDHGPAKLNQKMPDSITTGHAALENSVWKEPPKAAMERERS